VTGPDSSAALSPQALSPQTVALLRQLLPPLHLLLGLALAAGTLLFLFRIVLTWYPQVDLRQGPWRLGGAPTEPLLALTRRLVAPIGGVDVTPVIWVGLVSLLRELLVGQQGLISQVMLRLSVLLA
jgi:YggT family protein